MVMWVCCLGAGCGGTGASGKGDGGPPGEDSSTPDGCEPATCTSLGENCGSFEDGCGGMITCTSGCACTDANFETECPQRPCRTLAGCDGGECQYEPVTCGGSTCGPQDCSGIGCDAICSQDGCDTGVYPCGDALCAEVTQYCDPAPMAEGGEVVYQNVCVGPPQAGCGTCGLGARGCDTDADAFGCEDIPVPVLDSGGEVECDSTAEASTFLYVDTEYAGGESDGSRERPFATFAAAESAANARNARGIVIAGSPTFTEPLTVADGVSLYGGYGRAPEFHPDAEQRPTWQIGAGQYDADTNHLIGATAEGITIPAVLHHITITTADLGDMNDGTAGATNIALLADDSGALALDDVELDAGNAGAGVGGVDGASLGPAGDGGDANGRLPGSAPSVCGNSCTAPNGEACGTGGTGCDPNNGFCDGSRGDDGAAGDASGSDAATGGDGGASWSDTTSCPTSMFDVMNGFPGLSTSGTAGDDGTPGSAGDVGADGHWIPGNGTDGSAGTMGSWGGGGGAGGVAEGRPCCCVSKAGGDGGGGGAPGCGGNEATGGGGGGASIGLVVTGAPITIARSTIGSGQAGDGGEAAEGGAGGSGGEGAPGETVDNNEGSDPNYHAGRGGSGADGGDGGRGGHGGGGAGGDSVAVYCVGATVDTTDTALSPGSAGSGGDGVPDALDSLVGPDGTAVETKGCS
jgi:hypothetical protein